MKIISYSINCFLLLTLTLYWFNVNAQSGINSDDKWLSLLNNSAQEEFSLAPDGGNQEGQRKLIYVNLWWLL